VSQKRKAGGAGKPRVQVYYTGRSKAAKAEAQEVVQAIRRPAKKAARTRKAAPRRRQKARGRPRTPPRPRKAPPRATTRARRPARPAPTKGRKGEGHRDLPKAAVMKAIAGSHGLINTVAKRLHCHWTTARRYVDKWPEAQEAMNAETQIILDLAESKLFTAITKGEEWAIKFLLGRKGKSRGYSERQELTGPDGEPVRAILVAPKRFDSAKGWQDYVQEVPQSAGAPAPTGEQD
jgi:hypothetical protein